MALVSVNVNGQSYTIECKDGQEEHARRMADIVQKNVQLMRQAGFQGGNRPIVMAALLLADGLSDRAHSGQKQPNEKQIIEIAQQLEGLADVTESLADSIEKPYKGSSEAS